MILLLCAALLGAFMALLLLARVSREAPGPAPAPPPDPIAEEVSRWMHQWERGRA